MAERRDCNRMREPKDRTIEGSALTELQQLLERQERVIESLLAWRSILLVCVVIALALTFWVARAYLELESEWTLYRVNLNAMAADQMMSGYPREAIPVLVAALDDDPENVRLWLRLGDSYMAERQLIEARNAFRQAALLRSTDASALSGLGWSELMLGNPMAAIEPLNEAVRLGPNASNLAALGRAYAALGRCDQARPYLESSFGMDPLRSDVKEALAGCGAQ